MPQDYSETDTLDGLAFRYAGIPAETLIAKKLLTDEQVASAYDGQERIALGDREYTLHSGHLVPYYERPEHETSERKEQLVRDRVSRFFDTAERGIRVSWEKEDIAKQLEKFRATPTEQVARTLVGAMVDRMGRLAKAILQENTEGIAIEIPYHKDTYTAEFKSYYKFLIVDEKTSPIPFVELRDPSARGDHIDHDDVLFDLVREIGKPLVMPEDMIYAGILMKIGYAMEAIDQTHDALRRLIHEERLHGMLTSLHSATPHAPTYEQMLSEYTALCRARAGFKREDFENISPVDERIALLRDQLEALHKTLGTMVHVDAISQFALARRLLENGIALIHDMAIVRYPRNGRLASHHQEGQARKVSSVEWYESAVDLWCGRPVPKSA